MKHLLVIGAAAAAALSSPALAGNAVVNGSFENGFNGWTVTSGGGTAPVVIAANSNQGYPTGAFGEPIPVDNAISASPDAAGTQMVYFSSDIANPDILSQTINLIAGTLYDVGFDYYIPLNGSQNPFDAYVSFAINGSVFAGGNVQASNIQSWTNIATSYLAASTGAALLEIKFFGQGPTANNFAADIAFDRIYVNAPVPEPATWALMIGGLAVVGTQMRRRKTAISFA